MGIVVIGRNEGPRLASCLDRCALLDRPVVYVDSGSVDGSVALARQLGVSVVELDPARPFSAARARNEGFAALVSAHAAVSLVQFLDADCTLLPGWLDAAEASSRADPLRAVVIGPLQERHPDASVYNRMCSLEWKSPPGDLANFGSLGGIMLVRADVFSSVGGFDEQVIAGEDSGIRRSRRGRRFQGHQDRRAHGDPRRRHPQLRPMVEARGPCRACDRPAIQPARPRRRCGLRTRAPERAFWGVACRRQYSCSRTATHGLSLLLAGGYAVLGQRIARYRLRQGDSRRDARLYARFVVIGKFAEAIGLLRFHLNKTAGKFTIIEYK